MTSSWSLAGRLSGCSCSRTKAAQSLVLSGVGLSGIGLSDIGLSGIGHSCQAIQSLEKEIPFPAQGREFLFAGGGEAVDAAVAAGAVRFPAAGDPASLFEVVQGVLGQQGQDG